ncbi:MAG: hypothetical protein EBU90_24780 [Proteobacteria bacterium]|nr:hypothetical protein [Pseudomonadota bacterium]NBP16738.1 hypothetical protein [bacterium]
MIYARVKKSKQKKQPKAVREQYEQWLKSHHPKQIKPNREVSDLLTGYKLSSPIGRETKHIASLDTGLVSTLTKTGIMKDYHKLSASDRERVDHLANCVAPIHKSSYVYVSEGMSGSSLGRKNEVL